MANGSVYEKCSMGNPTNEINWVFFFIITPVSASQYNRPGLGTDHGILKSSIFLSFSYVTIWIFNITNRT